MKISKEKMVSEIELDRGDYEVLAKLAANPEFTRWREIVEAFQVQRAHVFLKGMELPPDVKDSQSYLRGGYDLWLKALRIVDSADQMLEELPKEHD